MDRSKWCLIGIPDHQGVMNVGGRVGAAGGPRAFLEAFKRLKGRSPVQSALESTVSVSPLSHDVSKNHRQAADAVRDAHRKFQRSVVVGGGHDHGFSHLLGLSEVFSKKKLGCLNIDAHLDVRRPAPLISSGSPFYLALEAGVIEPGHFIEFGIQSHCNASELWEYVESKRVSVVPFSELRDGQAVQTFQKNLKTLTDCCDHVAISLDLDAASAAFSPGVSAPQAEGFSASEVIEMMEIAGAHPKVVSLGIFELNPEHDLDDRTARLAATAAYHFIEAGLKSP